MTKTYIDENHGPQWDPDDDIAGILTNVHELDHEAAQAEQAAQQLITDQPSLAHLAQVSPDSIYWTDIASSLKDTGTATQQQIDALQRIRRWQNDIDYRSILAQRALTRARRDRRISHGDYETLALTTKNSEAANLWALLGIRDAIDNLANTIRDSHTTNPADLDNYLANLNIPKIGGTEQ
jgi:hypothetical protein